MSSSASSPARRALEDFVAGRIPADRLVAAVAGRFFGPAGKGEKDALRPVIELAERSAPGVVSLRKKEGGTGFDVQALERVIPEESLAALRGAAAAALAANWAEVTEPRHPTPDTRFPDPGPRSPAPPSWLSRVVSAVKRLFTSSA